MRDNDNETESTVSRDGITVYQTYQEERFGVPTVVLKLVSEREEPADVEVAVGLPPDLHITEVGFHPDYGREDWSVESQRIAFSATIGPEEDVTTMYAVESLADSQLDSLLDNLTIERVAGETGEGESAADAEFGPHPARQSVPTTGETSAESVAADDLAEVETYPAGENDEAATAESAYASDEDGDDGADDALEALGLAETDDVEGVEAGDDDVAQNIPSEVQQDADTGDTDESAPDEDVETAADETTDADVDEDADAESTDDAGETADEAEEEKADEDEDDAADAGADADAEEEEKAEGETDTDADVPDAAERAVLSEYATAELVAELDQRVDADGFTDEDRERLYELLLDDSDGATVSDELRVAHLQKRVSDMEASVEPLDAFRDRHGAPADAFAELAEEMSALGERVDSVEDDVSAVTDRVDEAEPRLDDVEDDVSAVTDRVDEVEPRVDSVEDDVSAVTDRVDEAEPRLDDVEDDVDSLAEEQAELESEVSSLTEWRERVKSTLSALGDV